MSEVADAHRHCERITRREAANFFYGIRLLPAAKREAMCDVYALARRLDDIGDEAAPLEDKRRALAEARAGIGELRAGRAPAGDLVLEAVADSARRFPLPLDAFTDLADGVAMDLEDHRYRRFDELELSCRRVAGSVGRLCLGIFGARGPLAEAMALADDLGVAMQLTNILRDVREDAGLGRVYLPAEDLEHFGWIDRSADPVVALRDTLSAGTLPARGGELVSFEAERAREWFARSMGLVERLDRRSAACVLAMTGIYRRLLERIAAEPETVLRRRVSLPPWEKAWVAARSLAGAAGVP